MGVMGMKAGRPSYEILGLFALVIGGGWCVYEYQFQKLPEPLTLDQVGESAFSEYEAIKHVRNLTQWGPHPVGSHTLDYAVRYVAEAAEIIKQTAHPGVNVEVDLFNATVGANDLSTGNYKGKTHLYADLHHVLLRISTKDANNAANNAILVSAHIDTVFSAEGAGDDSSSVAVMLELARGISQSTHEFKNAVIFFFNTGEEDGLNGAHSFITQHPWRDTLRLAIDLEALGIGGKSGIFQVGPNPWAIEAFAKTAKYPSGQIVSQDLFSSGIIKSSTDFQIYKDIGGLSGLDFAFSDKTAVYHTKNDKKKLLTSGSLQHLGENMLAFLVEAVTSPDLPKLNRMESNIKSNKDKAIYFDILGTHLITFRERIANVLYSWVIMHSILLWIASLAMGRFSGVISSALSCLSVILMWICSISFSAVVALFLPRVSSSAVPYVSSPWLVVGLFGAPALLGAFLGQRMGYGLLISYLSRTSRGKEPFASLEDSVAQVHAERWLFKAGLLQWLVVLMVGTYYKIGSTYLALAWLISPAFAYGVLEATWTPKSLPRPLKSLTLVIGMFVPSVLTSGLVIKLVDTVIGNSVRMVSNPGTSPDWIANIIVAIFIAATICLTMVYLLSYVHTSDAKVPLVIALGVVFGLSLGAVMGGVFPPFTEDTSRGVNVVHVVDAGAIHTYGEEREPVSYVSLFSQTPGNLVKEASLIGEGFVCGRDKYIDFVTFHVNYSCWTNKNAKAGWQHSDIPIIDVKMDRKGQGNTRETHILIDTRNSIRWALGINTREIQDFWMEDENKELIPWGEKTSVDGWHTVQFAGGRKSSTKFFLALLWFPNANQRTSDDLLLKLRTDVDRLTPPTKSVLEKLPAWCSLYGKSSSPHTFSFLRNLPIVSL